MAGMRAMTAVQADLLPVQRPTFLLMACDAELALLALPLPALSSPPPSDC